MWRPLYFVLLCIYSITGQQQEKQQSGSDSGERGPLLAQESGVGQGVSGGWETSRWKRAIHPHLLPEDIAECSREIQNSMKCMCGLRESSVDVPAMVDGEMFTFPKCVTVNMCTGPCWVKHMKCLPTAREDVPVPVMDRDCRKVYAMVETHKACKCTCTLTQDSCKDGQVFNSKNCQCECAKRRPCAAGTFFNMKTCRCECFENLECSTGFQFNLETCECESENSI